MTHYEKQSMKAKTIRRIIGITALVLWGVVIASMSLDEGVRIAYHLDGWAFGIASVLTPIYAVMLTIHSTRGRHWLIKTVTWISCAVILFFCGLLLYVSTIIPSDHRAWSNKDYVVYSESKGWIDPDDLVLYRREGFIDRKMYRLRCEGWRDCREEMKYTMYDTLDLIKEEITYTLFSENDSICRDTVFYRLTDGRLYNRDKKDSLLNLINKQ